MNAQATDLGDLDAATAGRDRRPWLGRLTKVELRKMIDTRSGFWLLLAVVGLTLLAVLITALLGSEDDQTFRRILGNGIAPAGILLPVVGILLVSSEWSQRTALVSFALVPGRARLIAAKVCAGVVLALAATAVAVALSAFATAIASTDAADHWSLPIPLLLQDILYATTSMLIGIGFGAALLASAPAIVLYFALPIAFSALGSIHAISGVIEWVNVGESSAPLTERLLSGHDWAQVLVTLILWMAMPLAIGLWRITRGDVG